MQNLFVYGTLRFPRFQKKAFGKVHGGEKASLHDYKKVLRKMPDGTYFVIVPKKNMLVRGLVLSVSVRELARADAWEKGYHRIHIHLKRGERVWAYAPKHQVHKQKSHT